MEHARAKAAKESAEGKRRPRSLLVRMRGLLLLLTIITMVAGGFIYWRYLERYPYTNDSYVNGNIVQVAAQVSGPVQQIYVKNNELVSAGTPLFDIDTAPYDIALKSAAAEFDFAADAAGKRGDAVVSAADTLAKRRAERDTARKAFDETKGKFDAGNATKEQLDEAQAAVDTAEENFSKAQEEFTKAEEEIGKGNVQRTRLRVSAAALHKAELDRALTRVSAPVTGWISGMDLRPGAMVRSGQPLFSIVENGTWWVDANFKETDLTRIRPGQPATVTIDMYPGLQLKGTVQSISAGSGAVFSLLPPENATGNWVKVTQRFTVRIALPELPADKNRPLRVGASAHVTVDTTVKPQ